MELLVSLVLFTVIVVGMSAFDIFGHFHSITSDRRALLQNELSLVLEHMTKHITGYTFVDPVTHVKTEMGGAIGDKDHPPFVPDSDGQGFSIRWDNSNGVNYAADGWIGYHQEGSVMYFYPNESAPGDYSGEKEALATHLLPSSNVGVGSRGFVLATPLTISGMTSYNACSVILRARWAPGPTTPATLENPAAEMQTTIITPSASIN